MIEMNVETARYNMIEQQIRPWNVIDPVVLEALDIIPREKFVPDTLKGSAFTDTELPIGFNQVMLAPKIEAKILQAVQIRATDTILEIGTGSGYMTALLAHLGQQVNSIEIQTQLSQQAELKLVAQCIDTVNLMIDDAFNTTLQNESFNVIVFTGSVPELPEKFQQSLKIGGRLFAVIGDAPAMESTLITRVATHQYATEVLFETQIPELENVPQSNHFIL
jgi:protein-L-isoaspartate(D-aspartate) O-methyltransferase